MEWWLPTVTRGKKVDPDGYPLSLDVRWRLPSVTRGKIVDLVVPQFI